MACAEEEGLTVNETRLSKHCTPCVAEEKDIEDADGNTLEGSLSGKDQMLLLPMDRAGPVRLLRVRVVSDSPAVLNIRRLILS